MNPIPYSVLVLAVSLIIHQQTSAPRAEQLRNLIHDPEMVDNVSGPSPIPTGTPHSEWAVNGSTYVIAYRNSRKDDPNDIVADIYFKNARSLRLRKLISLPVFSQVQDVKLISFTDDSESQLAFFRQSGQQDWLTIVALRGPTARKLFDYGARWIKLTEDKPPKILAHSHPDDTTETFVWCETKQKIVYETSCRKQN